MTATGYHYGGKGVGSSKRGVHQRGGRRVTGLNHKAAAWLRGGGPRTTAVVVGDDHEAVATGGDDDASQEAQP